MKRIKATNIKSKKALTIQEILGEVKCLNDIENNLENFKNIVIKAITEQEISITKGFANMLRYLALNQKKYSNSLKYKYFPSPEELSCDPKAKPKKCSTPNEFIHSHIHKAIKIILVSLYSTSKQYEVSTPKLRGYEHIYVHIDAAKLLNVILEAYADSLKESYTEVKEIVKKNFPEESEFSAIMKHIDSFLLEWDADFEYSCFEQFCNFYFKMVKVPSKQRKMHRYFLLQKAFSSFSLKKILNLPSISIKDDVPFSKRNKKKLEDKSNTLENGE